MIKKTILAILLAALPLVLLPLRAEAGLTLVSADAHSAVVEYRAEAPVFSGDQASTIVQLDGCQPYGAPGQPGLLQCLAHVAVPEGAQVTVEVIDARSSDYPGVKLAPVPGLALDRDGLDRLVYRADATAYGSTALQPADLARAVSVAPLRQLSVATVALHPLQYAPASGLLRVYTMLRARISWSGGSMAAAEVSDPGFEPVLRQLVLNYDAAGMWARSQPAKAAKGPDPFSAAPLWYKLRVAQDGIYRLTYNDLKLNGIDPAIIDPRTIKIYSGGSRALGKRYSDPAPDSMSQIAIAVSGESDGLFDPGEAIVFYGQGLNGWAQNRALPNNQYNNPYDSVNCYWLCWGGASGLRMATRDCEPTTGPAATPADFPDTLHFEQDRINPFNSGELWWWASLNRNNTEQTRRYSLPFTVPAAAAGQGTVTLYLRTGMRAFSHHLRWGVNGALAKDLSWLGGPTAGPVIDHAQVSGLAAGANTFDLELIKQGSDSTDAVLLDWFELAYRRLFQATDRQLRFRPDTLYTGAIRYHITGLASAQAMLLDISDPARPVRIATSRAYPAYCEFEDSGRRTYFASSAWRTPSAVSAYVPQRLRQTLLGTRYLLVTADECWPQAQALLQLHASGAAYQPARAIRLSAIYDEFGFGLRDPSAIRNALKYIYLNSTPARTSPAWCCLLGDGGYDYRWTDHSVPSHNLVPSHQEDGLYDLLDEYKFGADDDWFSHIETESHPEFIVGRIPARTAEEAWNVVRKVTQYAAASRGPWRNRAVLMADDTFEKSTPRGEFEHTQYSEALANSYLPRAYDQVKVYGEMREYPLNSQNVKQAAHDDLVKAWNEGAGIVNFFGHGAWWIWGHESYFRDTDVPNLANGERLPLVMMYSCGTSRFDNPHYESIGSSLVTRSGGGAIATIGAMRESSGGGNFDLAARIYSNMFSPAGNDIGQAFYLAKAAAANANNLSYVLLGDPGLALGRPQGQITLSLDTDSLLSRGRYLVRGILSGTGAPSGGQVQVSLFDITSTDSSDSYHNLKFLRPGKLIFRGLATVSGDSFRAWFTVPDLLHPVAMAGARVSAYAWNGSSDAAGATTGQVWIGGWTTGDTSDHRGPGIAVYANGLALANGDTIEAETSLTLRIIDRSGINIAPGVPEGEIRVKFDNEAATDKSQSFIYDINSDSSGQTMVTASKLSAGGHRVRIEAYDCMRNKGVWERTVTVADLQMKVEQAYNFPNPTAGGTTFTFQIRQPADVTIKVFTVAGRLIKTIIAPALPAGYNQIPWDGRDDDGDVPANGVYLYKVSMKNSNGENTVFSKLVIMR